MYNNIANHSKFWRRSILGPNEENVTKRKTAWLVVEQILLYYRIKEGEITGHMMRIEITLSHRDLNG